MKIRIVNRWWTALCGATVVVLILCIISAVHFSAKDAQVAKERREAVSDEEQGIFDKGRYTYASETCYTGAPYLSDVLFRTPFGRTDAYICNNDFLTMIGEENALLLADTSTKAAKALFDLSYQERDPKDPVLSDILTDGLHVLFADGTFTESKEDTVETINNWFIDSQTSMDAEFYTDKCMVFYDDAKVIVRGQLVFTVYGGNDLKTLQEYFDLESLEQGSEYAIVLEMEYISKSDAKDYASYKLCGLTLI